MTPYEHTQDIERQLADAALAFRERLERLYEEYPIEPRVKAMAMKLANDDSGGYAGEFVMGSPNQPPIYAGRQHKLICAVQWPIRPLWIWYADEARRAISLVEEFPE